MSETTAKQPILDWLTVDERSTRAVCASTNLLVRRESDNNYIWRVLLLPSVGSGWWNGTTNTEVEAKLAAEALARGVIKQEHQRWTSVRALLEVPLPAPPSDGTPPEK